MNKSSYGEKKPKILNVRLTENEYTFVQSESFRLDMSPSEYVRSVIDTLLIKSYLGGVRYENKQNN